MANPNSGSLLRGGISYDDDPNDARAIDWITRTSRDDDIHEALDVLDQLITDMDSHVGLPKWISDAIDVLASEHKQINAELDKVMGGANGVSAIAQDKLLRRLGTRLAVAFGAAKALVNTVDVYEYSKGGGESRELAKAVKAARWPSSSGVTPSGPPPGVLPPPAKKPLPTPPSPLSTHADGTSQESVAQAIAERKNDGRGNDLGMSFALDFLGRGPQSVARAAVAARDHATPDGPGVDLAALFGVPGGGGDARPGSGGPSVDLASLFGVPAGPGKVGPTPGGPEVDLSALFGVDLGRGPSVTTAKGPGQAPGGPPGGGARPNTTRTRSTDSGKQTAPRDNSGKSTGDFHTTERADPHPSASTTPAGPAPNPAPAKSEPTTPDPAKPAPTPAADPPPTASTSPAPTPSSTGGSGSGGTTTSAGPGTGKTSGSGGGQQPKPERQRKDPPESPPSPPKPVDEDPHKKHAGRPDPNDDTGGGGGGPRSNNDNPNPDDSGGGGRNPRARDASSRYRPADDDGSGNRGGGGGGPRSYDAYPDPESSGGGNPRGRFEMPNPEDAVGPRGPSARLGGRTFGNWFGSGSGAL